MRRRSAFAASCSGKRGNTARSNSTSTSSASSTPSAPSFHCSNPEEVNLPRTFQSKLKNRINISTPPDVNIQGGLLTWEVWRVNAIIPNRASPCTPERNTLSTACRKPCALNSSATASRCPSSSQMSLSSTCVSSTSITSSTFNFFIKKKQTKQTELIK